MVIRKPYAFLIKNFKKIHIFLFLLCAYIYYKVFQTSGFVTQFMELRSYDSYNEPISRYISFLGYLCLLLIIISNIALALLLRHKNKPWKLYLFPVIVYSGIFFAFVWTAGYFNSYLGDTETTNIRMISDLLFILSLLQYPTFLILFIRIFGVDLKKFNFNQDQEFLDLSSEDREEFEISIDIDKESFRRLYKRTLRNLDYVYREHKLIFNTVFVIIFLIILKNMYVYVFITNRAYKQGDTFNANGYTITINKSYYTDKNYAGKVITKNNAFVIVDMTIKNNEGPRKVNLANFHVFNGVNNYGNSTKLYALDFEDLGTTMDRVQELKRDQSINLIEIYRVDKKLPLKRFVLYYQELEGDQHLRKIRLNIEDLSKINTNEEASLGESQYFDYKGEEEEISFDDVQFLDSVNYITRICNTSKCENSSSLYNAKEGQKILYLSYASLELDGKDMLDFTLKYAKLRYEDKNGDLKTAEVNKSFNTRYYGKYLYLKVPTEMEKSPTLQLIYTIRNNQYIYNLKEIE